MTATTVSVNICMHNGSPYIGETLNSVLAQTFQDFEIVIVDDGSTDESADLVERQFPDERIKVVRQRHQTLRVARPVALAHSQGEFIAFLDSDDLWSPTKLERQVAVARAAPEAGLVFSDSELIDASGRTIGRFSDQYDFASMDLSGTRGYLELLRRGNFLASPTPFARAAMLRSLGGFNHSYQYVNDYDMWLRVARQHPLVVINEPLAKYRIHDTQFTQRHPDITLTEQTALLDPIFRSASYPRDVRIAIGDNLLGQHRLAWRLLLEQGRLTLAARAWLGMFRYPDRLRDSMRHRLASTAIGPAVEAGIVAYHNLLNGIRRVSARTRRAPRRVIRILRGLEPLVRRSFLAAGSVQATTPSTHLWIDGSPLGRPQAGYFNLLAELIRRLAQHRVPSFTVHVATSHSGRAALRERLGSDGSDVRFHAIGWRALHWSDVHELLFGWPAQLLLALAGAASIALGLTRANSIILAAATGLIVVQAAVLMDDLAARFRQASGHPRLRYTERLVRFLWRRFPAPRRRAPTRDTVEVLFWRGRFKWRDSRRIAVVQDMTTRILPELHTGANVAEFDEFLGYVQRHAHAIATLSAQSRHDIIDRIAVYPESVSIVPMPVHPQYVNPELNQGVVAWHRIAAPYVLCLGTIEPRKNLRRLVRAFESLVESGRIPKELLLVFVGAQGWDSGFREFVSGMDAFRRVRILGFVPTEHLPSLYHFASAVINPSLYEGFGLPVLEAMHSSAVVLASRVSSLPEVLGTDGILFDPYDTKDIAEAMLRALSLSPTENASYRRRCRERAEAHQERLAREASLPGLLPGSGAART